MVAGIGTICAAGCVAGSAVGVVGSTTAFVGSSGVISTETTGSTTSEISVTGAAAAFAGFVAGVLVVLAIFGWFAVEFFIESTLLHVYGVRFVGSLVGVQGLVISFC